MYTSAKIWEQNNKQRRADRKREIRRQDRRDVIEAYGGVCTCCGESRFEFMAIDHIDGGGKRHRESVGPDVASWLKRQGYPKEGFRVLCHNCNLARGFYGTCPHEVEIKQQRDAFVAALGVA